MDHLRESGEGGRISHSGSFRKAQFLIHNLPLQNLGKVCFGHFALYLKHLALFMNHLCEIKGRDFTFSVPV